MKVIDEHIKNLLSEHDCVIIPGFGAFIADYKAAEINLKKRSTPGKTILFNSKLNRNDGLLINALVEQENIDYKEAKVRIAEYTEKLGTTLQNGEHYTLEGIGSLQLDEAGFVQFIEDENNTCHLDSYGLNPIELEKINKERRKTSTPSPTTRRLLPSIVKFSAAAAVIVVLIILIRPDKRPIATDYAQLSPSIDSPQTSVATEITPSPDTKEVSTAEETLSSTSEKTKAESNNTTQNIALQKQYHVIIASLATEAKALDFVLHYEQKYGFEDLEIIEGSSRFRISAKWYNNSGEAVKYVSTLRKSHEKFKDAWVLPIKR